MPHVEALVDPLDSVEAEFSHAEEVPNAFATALRAYRTTLSLDPNVFVVVMGSGYDQRLRVRSNGRHPDTSSGEFACPTTPDRTRPPRPLWCRGHSTAGKPRATSPDAASPTSKTTCKSSEVCPP